MVKKKSVKSKTAKKKNQKKSMNEKSSDKQSETPTFRKLTISNEKEIAVNFAEKVHKRFDRLIKASVLFGSQAKNKATPGSDVDIIFIIDDASVAWDLELVSWYREELGKIVAQEQFAEQLHINTIKLTTWWQDLLNGDPVVINILRYGEALIDSGGFYDPIKALLIQGKIKSTPEAVYSALQRAPTHIARSRAAEMSAIEGVYWSMVDSAQAALMTAGKMPPSPEHLPGMLKETFVEGGYLKMDAVKALRDLYVLHKAIAHGEINDIKGSEIDGWQETAEKFLEDMVSLIDKMLENKK